MDECAKSLLRIYEKQKDAIDARLKEFDSLWEKKDAKGILNELLFCILTPQAEAHGCWNTICNLNSSNMLHTASASELAPHLHCARFKNKKSAYLVNAREQFHDIPIIDKLALFKDPFLARKWLADTICGYGYKEASHFLRNIGLGRSLAILDRHILRTLAECNVIESVPTSMTAKRYCTIEKKMNEYSNEITIPMAHLDFVMWHNVKKEIFK